jgi:hypothetical protein
VSLFADLLAGVALLAGRAEALGLGAGAGLAAVGLLALTVGTRQRLVLGVVGGALLGALVAVAAREPLGLHVGASPLTAALALAFAGAVLCGLVPAALAFGVAALPGAVLAAQVPLAGSYALGAAVGGVVAGVLGLVGARSVTAAFAGLAGGLLLALGLLAAGGASPLAHELARRPALIVGFALVTGVAGAALQLARTPEAPGARSQGSPP